MVNYYPKATYTPKNNYSTINVNKGLATEIFNRVDKLIQRYSTASHRDPTQDGMAVMMGAESFKALYEHGGGSPFTYDGGRYRIFNLPILIAEDAPVGMVFFVMPEDHPLLNDPWSLQAYGTKTYGGHSHSYGSGGGGGGTTAFSSGTSAPSGGAGGGGTGMTVGAWIQQYQDGVKTVKASSSSAVDWGSLDEPILIDSEEVKEAVKKDSGVDIAGLLNNIQYTFSTVDEAKNMAATAMTAYKKTPKKLPKKKFSINDPVVAEPEIVPLKDLPIPKPVILSSPVPLVSFGPMTEDGHVELIGADEQIIGLLEPSSGGITYFVDPQVKPDKT